jgi:hypothetical protein
MATISSFRHTIFHRPFPKQGASRCGSRFESKRLYLNGLPKYAQKVTAADLSDFIRGEAGLQHGIDDDIVETGLRCKFKIEWQLVECEQLEVISRLGGERSLPELGHSGFAAAKWADFELPLFDLLC